MTYEQPKIVSLASASDAIQGGAKGDSGPIDTNFGATVGAYEADE